MASVLVEVPDDLLVRVGSDSSGSSDALCLAAAFTLCSRGQLSTSQAARLAGLAYADFVEAAGRAKIELFPVDLDEFKEEISRGYTLGRQRVASELSTI